MQQPTLINGYWTWEGNRFHEMSTDQQIKFQTSFADMLLEHNCNTYTVEYWTRIGDDKEIHHINILATSPEQALYLVQQHRKFIIKSKIIKVNGKFTN